MSHVKVHGTNRTVHSSTLSNYSVQELKREVADSDDPLIKALVEAIDESYNDAMRDKTSIVKHCGCECSKCDPEDCD